jgi:valacyclovir hydrolase
MISCICGITPAARPVTFNGKLNKMPFAETSTGARLHYLDTSGDKPAVLLLHGLIGTPDHDFPRVIEWLKPDYRVVGLTLRGYGQSTPKPRRFVTDFYQRDAEDVLAFMDAIDLQCCHVIGYSDGGETALVAVGMQPDRFLSVTTIGATGFLSPEVRDKVKVYPGDWIKPEERALHQLPDVRDFTREWETSFLGMIDSGGDLSLRNAHSVTCPILILLGDRDTLNPRSAADVYAAKAPDARVVVVDDCGHPVHDDQWNLFIQEVGAHLGSIK